MLGHVEMQHLPTAVLQHEEHKQHLHGDGRYRKEIDGNHLAEVVVTKRLPGLAGWPRQLSEDSRDGSLRDLDAKHLGVLRESVAHATADWTRPPARSVGESRRQSRVCLGACGSPSTDAPRTCENAPAATERLCRPVRR